MINPSKKKKKKVWPIEECMKEEWMMMQEARGNVQILMKDDHLPLKKSLQLGEARESDKVVQVEVLNQVQEDEKELEEEDELEEEEED